METCHMSEQVPQIFSTCSALSSSLSSGDQGSPKFAVVRKGLGFGWVFFFYAREKITYPRRKRAAAG